MPDTPFGSTVPIEKFYTGSADNCGSLFKAGRITKYSEGTYVGLKAAHLAQDLDCQGWLVNKVTTEHAITGIDRENFSGKGDSGSFEINNLGKVVGLLLGRCRIKNVSYFTHSVDLIAHIKEVTGAIGVRLMVSDQPHL